MNWDDEVDIVCTGSGAPGLASAIMAVDAGGSVFVADPPDDAAQGGWLDLDISDAETGDYFAALSCDLGPLRRSTHDLDVPIRAVSERVPVEVRGTVAPFVGSRLREWTARCMSTPYGFLCTRLSGWQTTTTHTADGDILEVAEIGTLTVDPEDVGGSVLARLTAWAVERGVETRSDSSLIRIVFEEGVATGAVFATPDGPIAVRGRYGVIVSAGPSRSSSGVPARLPADNTVRVCLVGQHASRFGRVELLTSEPLVAPVSPTCRAANRHLRATLHETHDQSHMWRCGKVHGYPAFGQ